MKFAELASFFEKMEATASRLSLIEILSDLFKKSDKDEIEKIVYLTQGRIAPFFENTEIGMAEKTVAESIARAFGTKKETVLKAYGKAGDLGKVIESLSLKRGHPGNPAVPEHPGSLQGDSGVATLPRMTVEQVFSILTEIANCKGNGTVEKRLTLLSEMLQKVDPVSAKYLVRIPLGNLRLGIGDPTVLDALATAKLGDKTKRKFLEGAYNRTSDLGLIAKTLWQHGLKGVESLKVTVGKPIRSELCERLPNPEKVIEKMSFDSAQDKEVGVDVQYKFDGFRVQIHKDGDLVTMYSRNLENMTHMFPELIAGTLKQVKAHSAILDTEALAYNPESEEFLPFQETTKRRRKYNIAEVAKQLPLKAFVFDVLYKDGKSLIDEPLTKRMAILKEIIHGDPSGASGQVLIPTKNQTVTDPKKLSVLLEDAISKGLEGLVVKKLESPYVAGGRNFNWVKLKRHSSGELHDTIDCVILGYIFGKGKRAAFGAGALLVGVYDEKNDEFVSVSKIGTGLSDEEWQSIKKRTRGLEKTTKPARVNSIIAPSVWVKPEIVIEVLADEITRSPIHTAGKDEFGVGYALRFPRLVNFRDKDKKPEDATTVKELIEMYKLQDKK